MTIISTVISRDKNLCEFRQPGDTSCFFFLSLAHFVLVYSLEKSLLKRNLINWTLIWARVDFSPLKRKSPRDNDPSWIFITKRREGESYIRIGGRERGEQLVIWRQDNVACSLSSILLYIPNLVVSRWIRKGPSLSIIIFRHLSGWWRISSKMKNANGEINWRKKKEKKQGPPLNHLRLVFDNHPRHTDPERINRKESAPWHTICISNDSRTHQFPRSFDPFQMDHHQGPCIVQTMTVCICSKPIGSCWARDNEPAKVCASNPSIKRLSSFFWMARWLAAAPCYFSAESL